MVFVLITSHWYRFHPLYPSISPVLWHKCQRVFTVASCTSCTNKACWELWLSDDQPYSDYNGQWQRARASWQSCKAPNETHRRINKRKMYARKQIKICAEYQNMLHRPRLDLSDTPGLRPIGLSPGSWQTSLGLGSMSRYSAQILISKVDSICPE